jgi:hypothetical protein
MDEVKQPITPLSWSVLEFSHTDRHPDWLWYAGLIFGIAATISFFYGNIFFGIFLVIAGASVIIFAQRAPAMITVQIDEKELVVDREHIPYDRVRQFWIDETGKPDMLLVLVPGSFVPMMAIPLGDVPAEAIRTELKKRVPEVLMRESMGTKIAERLGF